MTAKRKKKLKRRLLGVGHPYFKNAKEGGLIAGAWPTALILLDNNFGKCTKTKSLNISGIGAWQKVRVYLEWTE